MSLATTMTSAWKARKTVALGISAFEDSWNLLQTYAEAPPALKVISPMLCDLRLEVTALQALTPNHTMDFTATRLHGLYGSDLTTSDIETAQQRWGTQWMVVALGAPTLEAVIDAGLRLAVPTQQPEVAGQYAGSAGTG